MELKFKNCRWLYPNYIDEKDLCLNGAIDEEIIDEEVCWKCSHFFSYIDDENIKIVDEDTESLI